MTAHLAPNLVATLRLSLTAAQTLGLSFFVCFFCTTWLQEMPILRSKSKAARPGIWEVLLEVLGVISGGCSGRRCAPGLFLFEIQCLF